jgi:hypothetical protein
LGEVLKLPHSFGNQNPVGVAHPGYDQGGGAFTFGGQFFAQLLRHNIATALLYF